MELLEGGSYYQLLHAPHQFCSAIGPISLGFQEMLDYGVPSGGSLKPRTKRTLNDEDITYDSKILNMFATTLRVWVIYENVFKIEPIE